MFALGHTGITLGAAGVTVGLESATASSAGQATVNGSSMVALVIGANLPDLIDKPIGVFAPDFGLGTGRGIAHTLVFNLGILAAGVYMSDRGLPWLMYMALASLGHLVLDKMWRLPRVLLWPLYGFSFPRVGRRGLVAQILAWWRALRTEPGVYVFELAGALLMVLFYIWRYSGGIG